MMANQPSTPLRVVAGREIPERFREVLRPGEAMRDSHGRVRHLPEYYYEIRSWDEAVSTQLTEHFGLWEFIDVDVREAEPMRMFPRYVPCGITLLATTLEVFRLAVGTIVRIAANGGYRSPGHQLSQHATAHCWGTAANIYRIGDEYLHSQDRVEQYSQLVRKVLPGVWTRPFGGSPGCVFDHVHVDLGFTTVVPLGAKSDEEANRS